MFPVVRIVRSKIVRSNRSGLLIRGSLALGGFRRDEGEPFPASVQRVGDNTCRLALSGLCLESSRSRSAKCLAITPCAGARSATRQPVAIGRTVGVHGARQVLDQIGRHTFEGERGAKYGVPVSHAQGPCHHLCRIAVRGQDASRWLGPRRANFERVGRIPYQRFLAQCRPNDPGRRVGDLYFEVNCTGNTEILHKSSCAFPKPSQFTSRIKTRGGAAW